MFLGKTNLSFINMSSKTRTKSLTSVELNDSVWNLKTVAWLALILLGICLLLFSYTKLNQSRLDAIPAEFEGKIVGKRVASEETQEGSYPYYRIIVELEERQLTVPVTREIYQGAEVGMRLKRSAKGLEVIPRPSR